MGLVCRWLDQAVSICLFDVCSEMESMGRCFNESFFGRAVSSILGSEVLSRIGTLC